MAMGLYLATDYLDVYGKSAANLRNHVHLFMQSFFCFANEREFFHLTYNLNFHIRWRLYRWNRNKDIISP